MLDGLPLAAGATILLCGACVGAGAALLAAARVVGRMERAEATAWSFALGAGVVGWAMFFLAAGGVLGRAPLSLAAGVACSGIPLLRRATRRAPADGRDAAWWPLCAILAVIMAVDLMEGLSPPADADSLAYHFALPKQFLAAGHLVFVPRAVDGAVPLLVQMTYLLARALGGEMAMTLWCMVTTWMGGALTYAAARRHMGASASLAVALLFLSVPAVIYAGGTGQVEPRLALFATVAAFAMARGIADRDLGFIAIAGMVAGFFAGGKYTGLLFGVACGLPLLFRWRSPRALAIYALAATLAGGQWYGWNLYNTGDPVFPALFAVLHLPDGAYWTAAQDALFRTTYHAAEDPLPIALWSLVAYPFVATLAPPAAIEATRAGLGPYGLLLLPFAAAGVWRFRRWLAASPLGAVALIAAGFYLLWFSSGVSQRVRHLLPIWPLFLVCVTAAALRWTEGGTGRRPLIAAVAATLTLQLGAQALYGMTYARYLFGGESRAAFLARNVPLYDVVAPVEATMRTDDRVLVDQRQLIYLFDKPVFYYHWLDQAEIRFGEAMRDPRSLLDALRAHRITRLLVMRPLPAAGNPGDLQRAAARLESLGCAVRIRDVTGTSFDSRTLRGPAGAAVPGAVYALKEEGCRP